MPLCASCGSPVEGRFCAKCGAAVGAGPAPEGVGASPAGTPGAQYAAAAPAGLSENAAGALCYALTIITGILFLVLEPYNRNRNIRFHAFQAIFLFVAWFAVWIARIMISIVLGFVSFAWILTAFLWMIIGLGFFILWLYMIIATYQGKTVVLPIIGPLAQKQA